MDKKPTGWQPIPKSVDQMKFEKQREEHSNDKNILELLYRTELSNRHLTKIALYLKVIMWMAIVYVVLSVIVGAYWAIVD